MGNSQPKGKSTKAPRGGRKPGAPADEKKAEQSVSGDGKLLILSFLSFLFFLFFSLLIYFV